MYAIVMNPDGTYYTSPVFGHYRKVTSADEYERYLESIYNQLYVVLSQNGDRLIKQYVFDRAKKELEPKIHIVDFQTDGWVMDADKNGCVAYLSDVDFDAEILEIEPHLLEKCCQAGREEQYREYVDIETDWDIVNFMNTSGYMHDASIETIKQEDDTLHILFDGCWGLKIEMWFSGDVSYSVSAREDPNDDPYWYSATLLKENGYFYFVDDEITQISDISDEYCWFKAKHIRYRVIPKFKRKNSF